MQNTQTTSFLGDSDVLVPAYDPYQDLNFDSLFTVEQMEMINLYLNENYSPAQATASDPFLDIIKNSDPSKGIPFLSSRQLFPKDMVAEMQAPSTTKERRAQIMLAFTKGYKAMQEYDFPAYRILFVEYAHLRGEIVIWID